jgi:hypothetical protein
MFEAASKNKLRFVTPRGVLSTEDLWDLSLTSLDTVAKNLNKQLKDTEESFIEERSSGNKTLSLSFDIVKHIISSKLAEAKLAKDRAAKQARRAELISILHEKESESLRAKTRDELIKELEDLG